MADVTVHRDFYSIRGEDGQLDDTVENLLADLEGKAVKTIRKVAQGVWPLAVEERAVVAEWVAAQHARVPAARTAQNQDGRSSRQDPHRHGGL
ncbi:DUF4238 domain-containing protein [Streptomyces hydrogenans]|uniref:DUF4238 domain-containing protein n=1 Tax=Streptomyces hydrogenans TaxID=1873719 RepID=UPI0036452AF5